MQLMHCALRCTYDAFFSDLMTQTITIISKYYDLLYFFLRYCNVRLSFPNSVCTGTTLSQLRKAVVDHVSDSFLETNVPLLVLIEAAKAGNERAVEEYALVFREHANKLIEVSDR